jgi:hypothetical protein
LSGGIKIAIEKVLKDLKNYVKQIEATNLLFNKNGYLCGYTVPHHNPENKFEFVSEVIVNEQVDPKEVLYVEQAKNYISRNINKPITQKEIADNLGMTFIVRYRDDFYHSYPQWGVLSNNKNAPEIVELLSLKGWREGKSNKDTALWTDDFHNLLSALRH